MSDSPSETPEFGAPDVAALERIAPDAAEPIQPDWVRELLGDELPPEHRMSSVRRAEHGGHRIEIVTTYEISVDGEPVHIHASVGDDGLVRCHDTPYRRSRSALDLVRHLIDLYPEAFRTLGGHDHGHHDASGEHQGHPS